MDAVLKSSDINSYEVLIDDEDFKLVKENGFVIAHKVSGGIILTTGRFIRRAMFLGITFLIAIGLWWFMDKYGDNQRSEGEIVLDSEIALKAAVYGGIVIAVLFLISFLLFYLDQRRRKAAELRWKWKFDTGNQWFYGPHGEPLISARESDIKFSFELVGGNGEGASWFLYKFNLQKGDYEILLFESLDYKSTIKFVHLLLEFGVQGVAEWENQIRKAEKLQ